MAKGKDLESFRSTHDKSYTVPLAIQKGLDELGDGWEYEGELTKRCSLSPTDFARFADAFRAKHTLTVTHPGTSRKRVVWAGTAKFAAQLRKVTVIE